MIRQLRRGYRSVRGVPVLSAVDTAIFTTSFFMDCSACGFCGDACCDHGVMVDVEQLAVLDRHAAELERYLGVLQAEWLRPDFWEDDPELPGGATRRTRVIAGRCVFRHPTGRGCRIHAFCLERGIPVHHLKPMFCVLFPLSFDESILRPTEELADGELVCAGPGGSLYRGARENLRHYFGPELIEELDQIEAEFPVANGQVALDTSKLRNRQSA